MMKPSILLVEDEAALVTLLTYNLERSGFEVRAAMDGEEALTMVAERVPDLVVLDWMLPKVSGLEVCRQLRRGKTTVRLPVIMLTARGEGGDRLRGLVAGADDYATPLRIAGLYWLTRLPFAFGVQRYHDAVQSTYATPVEALPLDGEPVRYALADPRPVAPDTLAHATARVREAGARVGWTRRMVCREAICPVYVCVGVRQA